jgi:hypothetical protein
LAQILRDKLLYAIRHCSAIDADATAVWQLPTSQLAQIPFSDYFSAVHYHTICSRVCEYKARV